MGGEDHYANPNINRTYTSSTTYALSGKIMLSAIIILFTVVVLIICLHVYARCFLVRARRRNNLQRRRAAAQQQRGRSTTHLVFVTDSQTNNNNNPGLISKGLDSTVLKSLPTFVFSTKTDVGAGGEAMECAVCLSEFEENEKGRLLPKCRHSFHTECIDMWFSSHSTCPICRSSVNNPAEVPEPEKSENTQIEILIDSGSGDDPEPESSSSTSETHPFSSCRIQEIDVSSSSSSSSLSVGARRKVFELVGVSIEVPRRGEEGFRSSEEVEILSSPGSQGGFRSPGSRIMALKRILSREKRSSSPASVQVSSSSSSSLGLCGSVAEIDPERGHEEGEVEAGSGSGSVQVSRLVA